MSSPRMTCITQFWIDPYCSWLGIRGGGWGFRV
jgi:hypothetical protein